MAEESFTVPKQSTTAPVESFTVPKTTQTAPTPTAEPNKDPVVGSFTMSKSQDVPIPQADAGAPLPTPHVDKPEPTFWESVQQTAGKIYDYVFDTKPTGERSFTKYGGTQMTPKKKEILDKAQSNLVTDLKKPESHMGPFLPEASPLSVIEFATKHQPNAAVTPSSVNDNAALLGYGWTNKWGKAEFTTIGKPLVDQTQISTIIHNTNSTVQAEQAKLQKEISLLKVENFEGRTLGMEGHSSKPEFYQANDKAIDEKTKKIAELETKRQQVEDFYGSIGRALHYAANTNPDFTTAVNVLNETPDGSNPDWKKYSNALKTSATNLKAWTYDKEATIRQGNGSLYINDPYKVIGANAAVRNPEGGIVKRGLYQSTEDKSEYRGIYENYKSIQGTVETDKKILNQLTNSAANILADGAKRKVPPAIVEEAIVKSGLRDAIASTQDYIDSKENILKQLEARVSSGGLNALAKFNATQEYQNSLLQGKGLLGRTAAELSYGADELVNKLSHGLSDVLTWMGMKAENISNSLYNEGTGGFDVRRAGDVFKQWDQVGSADLAPMEEKQLKDGSKVMVPFYEKGAGIIDEHGNVSVSKVNWDVLSYKGFTMAGEIGAMVLGGEVLTAPKVFGAAGWAEKGLAGADLAGDISINATRGVASDLSINMAKAGYGAVKYGSKFVDASLGFAVPSMVVFSPESIKAEMEQKSISQEQAVDLGMFRSFVEGYAFSLNPSGMMSATKRVFSGSAKNIAEDEAYRTLIETSWKKATGHELTDQVYRTLFDAAYHIPKGIAESALNLTVQMNMALFANAMISKGVARSHPDYYAKEYELTPENVGNTTISALATSLPFGISHIYGSYKNSEHARMSSLYMVARNPEYYLNHIDGLIDRDIEGTSSVLDKNGVPINDAPESSFAINKGRISEEEGLRQKNLVKQAVDALGSIADKIHDIAKRPGLSPQERHSLQFELFKEAVNERGITDHLAKDISDEERQKLIEDLKRSTDRATELHKYKGELEKATPEQRDKIEGDKIYDAYLETYLNPQLRRRLTIDDYRDRVADLAELISNETNPYLSAKYTALMDALDLSIADYKYKESNDPKHLEGHVSNLVDWIDERTTRAMEELDKKKRSGDPVFDGMSPEEEFQYLQQFVEDGMSVSQKALYEKRRDLINDEIRRRMGDLTPATREEPTEGPETKDPVTPSDTPPSTPSEPETKELGTEVDLSELNPDAKEIGGWLTPMSLDKAAENVKAGRKSVTSGLPIVYLDENGKYTIKDGFHRIAESILNGNKKFSVQVVPAPDAPISIPVIQARQAEQTEDYIRLQDSQADVDKANYTSLATMHKLTGIDMINEDGIGLVPDPQNPDNLLLVEATSLLAYVGREAEESPKGWKLKENELHQPYKLLQSARYFQPGTVLTVRINSIANSPYSEEAMKRFKDNAIVLVEDYGIPQSDIDAVLANPDRFRAIEMVTDDGLVVPMHDISYIRDNRVVGFFYMNNGDVINNLRDQFYAMLELNDRLMASHYKGETLKTKIVGTTFGHPVKDFEGRPLPVKEVYKNPDILKNIQLVRKPDEVFFNKKQVANWETLAPGRPVGTFPTSKKGVHIGLNMTRNKLSKEETHSIISAINFYVEYETARLAGDKETVAKLRAVSDQFSARSDDPTRYGIHTFTGVKWYINNLLYAAENTSKFKAPGEDRAKLAKVPFIDIDTKDGTITWSDQRLLGHLQEYESITDKGDEGFEALKKAGIYRQVLIVKGKPNPHNKYFLDQFEKFLLSRPKDFKQEKVESIKGKFEIPLITKENNEYRVVDTPKEAKNTGTSYHDYMLNNLTTTYREFQIDHNDGTTEHVYFEQPNKQFDLKFESDLPPAPDELDSVLEFYKKLKSAKTYAEAKELIKNSPEYPGIQGSIDALMNSLRDTMTYEEKEKEFNTAWRKHNELAAKINDFNHLTKSKQTNKSGVKDESAIHQLAGNMGYTLKKDPKSRGKVRYIATSPEGTVAKRKTFPAKPLDVKDGMIEWAGISVGKEDGMLFSDNYAFDKLTPHADFGLSNAELKRGFKAITDGNLSNLTAQAILKKIAEWKSSGTVDFVQGSGAIISRDSAPYEAIANFGKELKKELADIDEEFKSLSEEQFNTIVDEYNEWYDSLSPEEKEKHNDQYDQINSDSEAESGVYDEEESTGELPKTNLSDISGLGPIEGEKVEIEKGTVGFNKQQMLQLLGPSMYNKPLDQVAMKEMLQNSFDAIKSKLALTENKGRLAELAAAENAVKTAMLAAREALENNQKALSIANIMYELNQHEPYKYITGPDETYEQDYGPEDNRRKLTAPTLEEFNVAKQKLLARYQEAYDSLFVTENDAIKSAKEALEALQHAPATGEPGVIDIHVDSENRTITVKDNGLGMTKEVVKNAFLTVGGTNKEGLSTGQRSGGLGLAKVQFLLGSKRIKLETVRDGILTTVDATGMDLWADDFEIRTEETDRPSGTSLTIEIPKSYKTADGQEKDIAFDGKWLRKPEDMENYYNILRHPLIGHVKVNYHVTREGKTTTSEAPLGVNNSTKKLPPLFTRASFSWGTADVYVAENKNEDKYNINQEILSSGLYQFGANFGTYDERIPYDIVVDIKPGVEATHEQYPFNNQREGFKPTVTDDISALNSFLIKWYRGESEKELVDVFKDIKGLPKTDVTKALTPAERERFDADLKNTLDESKKILTETDSGPRVKYKTIIIEDRDVRDDMGKLIASSKDENKRYDKTFKSNKELTEVSPVDIAGIDQAKPQYHNNTNVDYLATPGAAEFFSDFGSVVLEMVRFAGNELGSEYQKLKGDDKKFFAGVSIDRTYGGVHTRKFLDAIFINPLSFSPSNLEEAVGLALHITLHEINHTTASGEGANFTTDLAKLWGKIYRTGKYSYYEGLFRAIFNKHFDTFKTLKHEFDKSSTKNLSKSFTGEQLTWSDKGRPEGDVTDQQGGQIDSGRGEGNKELDQKDKIGDLLAEKIFQAKPLKSQKEGVSLPTDMNQIEEFILDNRPFKMRPLNDRVPPVLRTEVSHSKFREEVASHYSKLSAAEKAQVGELEPLLEKYQGWSDEDIIKEIDCRK